MATKRMFSMKIVDSGAFLEMPLTTQCLYFHLNMRADDDGFVDNPKQIMRMVGCSEDDMRVLMAKKFVLTFESGIIVIKHWRMHNTLQSDRYSPTTYQDEKALLEFDENKAYRFPHMETKCFQNVSIDKNRLDIDIDNNRDGQIEGQFSTFWSAYPNKKKKQDALKSFKKIAPDDLTFKAIMDGLDRAKKSREWIKDGGKFIPHPTTWLNGRRWEDEYTSASAEGRKVDESRFSSIEF